VQELRVGRDVVSSRRPQQAEHADIAPTRLTTRIRLVIRPTAARARPAAEARRVLAEVVRLVAEHDGVLLVPSFAIGRTQELIWALDRLVAAGEVPELPLYLDSPMAREATSIYREHAEYYDEETRRILEAGDTPLDYPRQRIVKTVDESRAIAHAPGPT